MLLTVLRTEYVCFFALIETETLCSLLKFLPAQGRLPLVPHLLDLPLLVRPPKKSLKYIPSGVRWIKIMKKINFQDIFLDFYSYALFLEVFYPMDTSS